MTPCHDGGHRSDWSSRWLDRPEGYATAAGGSALCYGARAFLPPIGSLPPLPPRRVRSLAMSRQSRACGLVLAIAASMSDAVDAMVPAVSALLGLDFRKKLCAVWATRSEEAAEMLAPRLLSGRVIMRRDDEPCIDFAELARHVDIYASQMGHGSAIKAAVVGGIPQVTD